jgi:hypothetical protein
MGRYLPSHLVLALFSVAALASCEKGVSEPDFSVSDPNPSDLEAGTVQNEIRLLGSWELTNAARDGEELPFPPGFSLFVTFHRDGNYSMSATNTLGGFVCEEPDTSCTVYGWYEHSDTELTFHEVVGPHPGATDVPYEIPDGRLIIMEEDGVMLAFKRTRRDCWVRVCD